MKRIGWTVVLGIAVLLGFVGWMWLKGRQAAGAPVGAAMGTLAEQKRQHATDAANLNQRGADLDADIVALAEAADWIEAKAEENGNATMADLVRSARRGLREPS